MADQSGTPTTNNNSAIQALLNAGADAMSNMYELYIKFPTGKDGDKMALTVRADGFKIPEASVETYPVEYHGHTLVRPKTKVTFERKFTVTFRMDAAYGLHETFLKWQALAGNPITGGVSNVATSLGTVEVQALKGAYIATENLYNKDSYALNESRGVQKWTFTQVWVSKVSQPEFKTEGGDKLTFTVDFNFGDCDYPGYKEAQAAAPAES